MGYQVLARKYRPQRFCDVAGQDHVTRTLLTLDARPRRDGYIFSGHRGIEDKPSARILAWRWNCRTEVGSADRPPPSLAHCDSCTSPPGHGSGRD